MSVSFYILLLIYYFCVYNGIVANNAASESILNHLFFIRNYMKISSLEFKDIINHKNIIFKNAGTIKLMPDKDGNIYFKPQLHYNNNKNYPLLNGINCDTTFCKFKLDLPRTSGVYLWVVDNEIIYIGEALNFRSRFNNGYGNISPRNCYKNGQSTNVRMNRIVLSNYENNSKVDIYIYETPNRKQIETYLLSNIHTKYNIKHN